MQIIFEDDTSLTQQNKVDRYDTPIHTLPEITELVWQLFGEGQLFILY